MAHVVYVDYAIDAAGLPDRKQIARWVNAALEDVTTSSEVSIRIVGEAEGEQLNRQWRSKQGPTNVLSFPADVAREISPRLLGDIVICAPVVDREAREQGKSAEAHWAHMLIHGTLHLLGYDHTECPQAERMESLEISILEKLDLNNPYT